MLPGNHLSTGLEQELQLISSHQALAACTGQQHVCALASRCASAPHPPGAAAVPALPLPPGSPCKGEKKMQQLNNRV